MPQCYDSGLEHRRMRRTSDRHHLVGGEGEAELLAILREGSDWVGRPCRWGGRRSLLDGWGASTSSVSTGRSRPAMTPKRPTAASCCPRFLEGPTTAGPTTLLPACVVVATTRNSGKCGGPADFTLSLMGEVP